MKKPCGDEGRGAMVHRFVIVCFVADLAPFVGFNVHGIVNDFGASCLDF